MEAIKNVYSLEILNKSTFKDCNYFKFECEKRPKLPIQTLLEVDGKAQPEHSFSRIYQHRCDEVDKELTLASDYITLNQCIKQREYQTTDSSNTSENLKMNRIPKSGFIAKRPGYVYNYNEPASMVVKHPWQRKLENYAAVRYMRDVDGKLVSSCLAYRPYTLAAGDASLQSFQYKMRRSFLHPWKKPLRLFDKQGLPLTDRLGKPLLDIFGVPKVLIDTEGQPICDSYGDPVFNARGVSTVYADTDSTVMPVQVEETSIPLLDVTKKHVVFLYDSKGNPLTDFVGRPLVNSSGSAMFGMQSTKSEPNQYYLKPLYGKSPIENVVRNIQIFDSDGNPLTDEEGVILFDQFSSPKIFCNDYGLPVCDANDKPLGFKYGKRISLQRNSTIDEKFVLRDTTETNVNNTISNTSSEELERVKQKSLKDIQSEDTQCSSKKNSCNNINKICYRKQTKKLKKSKLLFLNQYFNKDKCKTDNGFLKYYRKSIRTQISSNVYNEYGNPLRDHQNKPLYDKYGIPFTGENGVKLSDEARKVLREILKNVPIPNPKEFDPELKTSSEISFYKKYDSFGRPSFDKWGRPLYDLYGKLIYDSYGRPLTDAYGRPLTDSIGQPLLDSKGQILTARSTDNASNPFLYDIFGRPTHDRFGNVLFDIYGRPKYDIYTNAIYDNIGRPVTDANGVVLKDSSGNVISPFPSKPLYKDVKKMLPVHIDKLLSTPVMKKILKWKQQNILDAFGGPLFDDYGRPMYSKSGKPLFDKYGRPLYDKAGQPYCDSFGRPLSDELRSEPSKDTLSVIDSLKLLKLSGDTPKWMETNEYQLRFLTKNTDKIVKILQPCKGKPTKYIYALTRITMFPDGKRVLEILEAPLSPSTSLDMHRLPWDGKPVVMKAKKKEK